MANPFFAAGYDAFMRPLERRLFGRLRAQLLAGLSGRVLEIGAGTGANFAYLTPSDTLEWVATEPDAAMRDRARVRAEEAGLAVTLHDAPIEALPYPDASFDAVVVTLVLCSVHDPRVGLAEIRRVLKPGGELRYLEHVRGSGAGAWAQDRLRPAWAWLGAGCQLNRRTGELVREAGFAVASEQAVKAPFPILRLLVGTATR